MNYIDAVHDFLTTPYLLDSLKVVIVVSAVCAVMSLFLRICSVTLVSQSFSASTFAGIGFALFYGAGANDFFFPLLFSLANAVLIAYIHDNKRAHADTAIATSLILFSSLGVVLFFFTAGYMPAITSFLLSNIYIIPLANKLIVIFLAMIVLSSLYLIFRPLGLYFFRYEGDLIFMQRELRMLNYIFYILIAFTVSISAKVCGFIFTNAAIVFPGICALYFTQSIKSSLIFSVVFGVFMTVCGFVVACIYDFPAEPMIALFYFMGFVVCLFVKGRPK